MLNEWRPGTGEQAKRKNYNELVRRVNSIEGASFQQGFIDYNDTSTSSSPLSLVADTWTQLPNDGQGAFSNDDYIASYVTNLMDTSTGKIDPRDLSLGDILLIRNDFSVTPQQNAASLSLRYTLGSGGNVYTLEKSMGRLDEGAGIPYRRNSLEPDLIYMGDSNTKDNLIGVEVKLSTKGSVVNAGSAIAILRFQL